MEELVRQRAGAAVAVGEPAHRGRAGHHRARRREGARRRSRAFLHAAVRDNWCVAESRGSGLADRSCCRRRKRVGAGRMELEAPDRCAVGARLFAAEPGRHQSAVARRSDSDRHAWNRHRAGQPVDVRARVPPGARRWLDRRMQQGAAAGAVRGAATVAGAARRRDAHSRQHHAGVSSRGAHRARAARRSDRAVRERRANPSSRGVLRLSVRRRSHHEDAASRARRRARSRSRRRATRRSSDSAAT